MESLRLSISTKAPDVFTPAQLQRSLTGRYVCMELFLPEIVRVLEDIPAIMFVLLQSRIGQWRNSAAVWLRETILSTLPASFFERKLRKVNLFPTTQLLERFERAKLDLRRSV